MAQIKKQMKKNYFLIALIFFFGFQAKSQAIWDTLTFETLLPQVDTFWNGSDMSGGFSDPAQNRLFFENNYSGGFWDGFSLSSERDTVTSGFINEFSAISGRGVDSSITYVVSFLGYSSLPRITLSSRTTADTIVGAYFNNSTYAYLSMLNGDSFAKKFGDTVAAGSSVPDGTNGEDWFMLTVYDSNGDSVDFYLADYRFADSALDYIVKEWTWVDLSSLNLAGGYLDFNLRSSDVGSFGMNTPGYFCLDNLIFKSDLSTTIAETNAFEMKAFPNPTQDYLTLTTSYTGNYNLAILDVKGNLVASRNNVNSNKVAVDLTNFVKGIYMIQLSNSNGAIGTQRIIKN